MKYGFKIFTLVVMSQLTEVSWSSAQTAEPALDPNEVQLATQIAGQAAATVALQGATSEGGQSVGPDQVTIEQHSKLLGQELGVLHQSVALPAQNGMETKTQVQFLGSSKTLMETSLEAIPSTSASVPQAGQSTVAPNAGTVLATTNWYVGGTKIWSGNLNYQKGSLVYTGGISPTQIPFPLLMYPVGPLVLEVDAGVEFEGSLNASMSPGWSIPIKDTVLKGKLDTKLNVTGYLEGYAKLLVVRGGVGGRLSLIDGDAGVSALIYLNGSKAQLSGMGKVQLFNGDIYAFVDTKFVFGKWKRILNKNLYQWNGKCFAFGSESCATP